MTTMLLLLLVDISGRPRAGGLTGRVWTHDQLWLVAIRYHFGTPILRR